MFSLSFSALIFWSGVLSVPGLIWVLTLLWFHPGCWVLWAWAIACYHGITGVYLFAEYMGSGTGNRYPTAWRLFLLSPIPSVAMAIYAGFGMLRYKLRK